MIHRDDRDGIAVLRIEHGKANAVDLELFAALEERLDEIADAGVRGVVITGSGSIFSAGVELFRVVREGAAYLDAFLPVLSSGLRRVFTLPLPVVAAVNGHAIAGGCILAAACDRRVMTDDPKAKIGIPELRVGVPFPVVPLEVMRELLPGHRLQDLVSTGRVVPPQEALAIGLADELAPAGVVLERAIAAARRYAAIDRGAWAVAKRQLRALAVERMERDAPRFDPEVAAIWKHPDTLAAIQAYLDATVGKS